MTEEAYKEKFWAVLISAQLINFTRNEHATSDHFI